MSRCVDIVRLVLWGIVMKRSQWQAVKAKIAAAKTIEREPAYHVCAWCQFVYDSQGRRIGEKLTREQYGEIESHGICSTCKREVQES